MKNTVYLIRHGITEGNKRRLYYGSTDLPLAPEGIEALKKRREAGIYPDEQGFRLITSGLSRTKQTLFEIYGKEPDISDKRLNEVNFGDFEMKSYDELKDIPEYQLWISGDNWHNYCPNGESGAIMFTRAKIAMDEYCKSDCIIICHGGIISSLMQEYFPDAHGREHFYKWQPRPCEGYKVVFDDGKPIEYSEIKLDETEAEK